MNKITTKCSSNSVSPDRPSSPLGGPGDDNDEFIPSCPIYQDDPLTEIIVSSNPFRSLRNLRSKMMVTSMMQSKKIKNNQNSQNTDSASTFFTRQPYYLSTEENNIKMNRIKAPEKEVIKKRDSLLERRIRMLSQSVQLDVINVIKVVTNTSTRKVSIRNSDCLEADAMFNI